MQNRVPSSSTDITPKQSWGMILAGSQVGQPMALDSGPTGEEMAPG
jgi:hypothetical protein